MTRTTHAFASNTPGSVVLYNRIDTSCESIKREGIQQTAATKKRSVNFGVASRAASPLRQGLKAVIPCPTDKSMQGRFSGAIAKWLCLQDVDTLSPCNAAPFLSGFQFTNETSFTERFKVPVTVSNPQDNVISVRVNNFVPISDVSAPAGTLILELVISVAGCTLATGMPSGNETKRVQVPYNNSEIAAQILQFNIHTGLGTVIVTGAWLQYYVMKNNRISRTDNPAFIPAGVLNARYA